MARILLVDDDPSVVALERLFLTEDGYDVLTAHDARTALNLLRTYEVDLIIVDIIMPELSGFQLVNTLKNSSLSYEYGVAFLTSKAEKKDVVKAAQLGADFYVTKPLNRKEFSEKIANFFMNRPPKKYPRAKMDGICGAEAKVRQSVQIISVTELGVEILANCPFELDQIIELSTSLFHEIPLKNPLFQVMSTKEDRGGLHRVQLTFLEADPEVARKIRRWISYRPLRR